MTKPSEFLGCFLVCLLTAGSAFSLPTQTQPAPAKKADYSKEADVIENYRVAVRLENNGTMTREMTARIRMQSDAGVKEYGILEFGYNSANERLDIEYVKVIRPDGTGVTTPPANVQDVTSAITRAAPMYSDYREKHVVVQGLDAGDVLEYAVQVKLFKPLIPGQFWFDFDFIKSEIALDEELVVNVPKGRKLIVRSPGLTPAISGQGGRRVYTWKTANLKDETDETVRAGHLPPPAVEITSFQNWAQVGSWWGRLEEQQDKPTAAIRTEALELTKNAATTEEKVEAIYKYVSEQYRYVSISFGVGRYKPHSAAEVLNNQYGDCKDKQTLLASLLQAVGLRAYPALLSTTNRIDPDVPSPGQFDHVVSVVPLGQKLIWMDTTAEVAPEGFLMPTLLGKQALLIPDGKLAYLTKTPSAEPFQSFVRFNADGKLSKDGTFTGKIQRSGRGYFGVAMRLIYRNAAPSQWQEVTQGISRLSGFGGTVSDVMATSAEDIDHPFHFSYDYTRKNYADWKDHRTLPALPPLAIPKAKKSKGKAPGPIYLGVPTNFIYTSKIELPRGFSPRLPKPVDVKFDFGEYHAIYAFKNGVLIAERDLTIRARKLPATRRKDYLKLRNAVTNDEEQLIPLSQGQASAGPAVNPQAMKLFKQAVKGLQLRDFQGARELAHQALSLDPKFERAWVLEGTLRVARGDYDEGYADLHKAIALNPKDPRAYWGLASGLTFQGKHKKAIQALEKVVKLSPTNNSAHLQLGLALLADKQYSKAVPQLQTGMAADEGNPLLEMRLARAYAGAGDATKAAATFKKVAAVDPTSAVWKQAANSLAKFKQLLPAAQHYADMAVKADEARTAKLTIANGADFSLMRDLASDWNTLGWVYFKENNLVEAQRYLKAAWNLAESGAIGDRLGQVYEKLGNRQAAIKMYALAAASPNLATSDARSRLSHLLGNDINKVEAAVRKADLGNSGALRVKLGKITKTTGSADFLILFSPGPKVADLKFMSGDQQLKTLGNKVRAARFRVLFPDNGTAKILHHGVLVCPGRTYGCDFTLSPLGLSSE